MKLSVIIPCYNEENTISILIDKVSKCSIENIEIIVVNDCSTDLTESVLNRIQNQYSNLKIYNHKKNQGKGAAIRTGIAKSSGDIILIQDADLEYDPSEYYKIKRMWFLAQGLLGEIHIESYIFGIELEMLS